MASKTSKAVGGGRKKAAVSTGGAVKRGGSRVKAKVNKGGITRGGVKRSTRKPKTTKPATKKESAAPGSGKRNFNAEGVGARSKKNMRQNKGRAGVSKNADEGAPRGGAAIKSAGKAKKRRGDKEASGEKANKAIASTLKSAKVQIGSKVNGKKAKGTPS